MYICTYFRVVLCNFNVSVCPHYSMYYTNVCTYIVMGSSLVYEMHVFIRIWCCSERYYPKNISPLLPPTPPKVFLVKTHYNESQGTTRILDYITDFNYVNQLPFYYKALTGSHEFIHYMQKFTLKDFFITSFLCMYIRIYRGTSE